MALKKAITWVVGDDINALIGDDKILVFELQNEKLTGHAQIVQRDQITTDDASLKAELEKKPAYVLINKEAFHWNFK